MTLANGSKTAVTSAGNKRDASKAGWLPVLAGMLWPALAQAEAKSMEQIEGLMREQLALQSSQSVQIQNLRQQLGSQALENQTQDWQLTGGLLSVVLVALMGAWLLARWPRWQQARLQKKQARSAERTQTARHREKHSLPQAQLDAAFGVAFVASGLHSGAEIDHGGQGIVRRLVRKTKRHQRMSEPTPDSNWLVQIDDLDSRFLADDALREYELRKTVGLISEGDDAAQNSAVEKKKAAGVEDVWHSLEEVALADELEPDVAKPEPEMKVDIDLDTAQPGAVNVDVSQEVQRVRKSLQERRKDRSLQTVTITQAAAQELGQTLGIEASASDLTVNACAVDTSWSDAQEKSQDSFDGVSTSVRAMSDGETRLALAHEFEKLGAKDEAAQLFEEVLASGLPDEQARARRFLQQMPGR
jgi:FimV-like protein